MNYKKRHLAYYITKKGILPENKSKLFIDTLLQVITNKLLKGGYISIQNFGRFYTKTHKARNYFNFWTGGKINKPAKKVAKFKPSDNLLK